MKNRYAFLAVVTAVVIALDQGTKLFIDRVMELHSTIVVINNFFNITYIRNKGAAFGILAESSYRLPFFIGISIVAIVVIMQIVRKLKPEQAASVLPLSMIFAGAMGNLIDRIRLGEVIDFLDFHWYEHHWPAFNVADSAICVGVFILAVEMIMEERRKKV
jgi:signal peptidase II